MRIAGIRTFLLKFFLTDDSPYKVAAGAALGVFWGIMPGEGIGTTIVTAAIFRFNRTSAVAGALATNMWSSFVVLPLAGLIGGYLFGTSPKEMIENFKGNYHLGMDYFFSEKIFSEIIFPMLSGFLVVSVAISLATYFVIYVPLKLRKIRFK